MIRRRRTVRCVSCRTPIADALVLRIPKTAPDGFDVELEANGDGLELRCGGMHTPLSAGPQPDQAVRDALGLVRDLLSPGMRLREQQAGGSPYRWSLEATSNGEWHPEYVMGLLVWNYFGRRSERICQNVHLPARDPQPLDRDEG
jgi:hypothetical protein